MTDLFKGENALRYFRARLPHERWTDRVEVSIHCPFHDDRSPSASVKVSEGVWHCCACNVGGGVLDFEMRLSKCDEETAMGNVRGILGIPAISQRNSTRVPDAIYQYPDSLGGDIVEKLRFNHADGSKHFEWRRPDGKCGYISRLPEGFTKRLYRQPEIVRANFVIVVEGERDADNVAKALAHMPHLAATTSPDGAAKPGERPKWPPHFAPYFTGKYVAILSDNDPSGIAHGQAAAKNIYHYAARTKLVDLPGLPEHGDVSDFLTNHTGDDLLNEIKKAELWKPAIEASSERGLSVPAPQFCCSVHEDLEFLVKDVIPRGANGFVCAPPKNAKSWVAADISVSLSLGVDWLGFSVRRPVKVLLVSREDNPALTSFRIKQLFRGKSASDPTLLETNLHINSRAQTPELMLDNPEQVEELRAEIGRLRCEFLVLDVFNVLHAADENDNQEMCGILRTLSRINTDFGCSIAVVHHFNKADGHGGMTQRLRGSSAIAGWAEWLIGIRLVDETNKIRCLEFESKAVTPPEPVTFRIVSDNGVSVLRRVLSLDKPSGKDSGHGGNGNH